MPDLVETIIERASEPVSSAADGQSVTDRSIGELVQADQYSAGKPAAAKRRRGLRFSKVINPGALSDGGYCGNNGFNTL